METLSERSALNIIVRISGMATSNNPRAALLTHDLGSCIAVCVHDRFATVGGILHYLLPLSTERMPNAPLKPEMYADTGVPLLFERLYSMGAVKSRLTVRVVGGASVTKATATTPRMDIGVRNHAILRKMFWQNQILINAEDVGGTLARNVRMEIGTGLLTVSTLQGERTL